MTAVPFDGGSTGAGHLDDEVERDPDGLASETLALVRDAAALLSGAAVPRPDAVEQVVSRLQVEAVVGAVLGTVGGSLGRVARAAPDLLGLVDPAPGAAADRGNDRAVDGLSANSDDAGP
ncbi:hypothetical protein [Euzebya tangerina]|uniref:hypothetical protein n=1 Tax=Euzebya tangerina TaxID=591198 RepID=UPI000E30F695|nr:hypothetical protein [Euzebya tangerina]